MTYTKAKREDELLLMIMAKLKADDVDVSDLASVKKCLDDCVGGGLYDVFINAKR